MKLFEKSVFAERSSQVRGQLATPDLVEVLQVVGEVFLRDSP